MPPAHKLVAPRYCPTRSPQIKHINKIRDATLHSERIESASSPRGRGHDTSRASSLGVERTIACVPQFRRLRIRNKRRPGKDQALLFLGCILALFNPGSPIFRGSKNKRSIRSLEKTHIKLVDIITRIFQDDDRCRWYFNYHRIAPTV
jgi:hypothetical protein